MIKTKNIYFNSIVVLSNIILLFIFTHNSFSQNVTKAEIKKPELSLVGQWSVAMEIRDGQKKGIVPDFLYEFRGDGTYEFSYIYRYEEKSKPGKTDETLFVMEKGTWVLADGGKTLKLIQDTLATKGINPFPVPDPYKLDYIQIIKLEDSQRFTIKKVVSGKNIEYVYFRRFASPRNKVGPAEPNKR